MMKLIHNVSLLAGLIALTVGLWQDWAIWFTMKRILISYLGFFCFGSILTISIRAIPLVEGNADLPDSRETARRSAGVPGNRPRPDVSAGMETANDTASQYNRKVG